MSDTVLLNFFDQAVKMSNQQSHSFPFSGTNYSEPAAVLGDRTICDHTPKPDVFFLGSPLALGPPLNDTWSVTGHPTEILGLSPSFFSSPGKLLPEQILEDGAEYLTQGEHPGLDLTLGSFRKHMVMPAKCTALCRAVPGTQG